MYVINGVSRGAYVGRYIACKKHPVRQVTSRLFLLPCYAVGNAGNFIIAAMRTSNLACSKYFQVRFSTRMYKTPWNPVTYYDLRVNERNTS
jgi:hypothetical protein